MKNAVQRRNAGRGHNRGYGELKSKIVPNTHTQPGPLSDIYRRNKRRLVKLSKFISASGWISSTIFFIAGLFYQLEDTLILAISAILVGFCFERLADIFERSASEEDALERHSGLMEALYSASSIQSVGSSDASMGQLYDSARQATRVRNTFLNVGGAPGHRSSEGVAIEEIYTEFLSRNDTNLWQDIVSVNELYEFRHTRLFTVGNEPSAPEILATHQIAVLRSSMPIINFIIFSNPIAQRQEVYFGWIFDRDRTPTTIYKSIDPHVIELFDKYFKVLWAEKSAEVWDVDYHKAISERGPRKRFVVDKQGVWVTIAVRPLEPGEQPNHKDDGPFKILNYAGLTIEFDGREPIIEGAIVEDISRENRRFVHTDITEAPNRLFFEYEDRLPKKMQKGFCVYGFARAKGRDAIKGFLIEGPDGGRIHLFGLKVRGNDAHNVNVADASTVTTILDRPISGTEGDQETYRKALRELYLTELNFGKDSTADTNAPTVNLKADAQSPELRRDHGRPKRASRQTPPRPRG